MDERINLLGCGLPSLARLTEGVIGQPFRLRQLHHALYQRGVRRFAEMTALPLALRSDLEAGYRLDLPAMPRLQRSHDGTRKALLRLNDGREVEAVDIPDEERRTFCLSSQAGCALACRFCVTGYWGAGRDLSAAEIVGQAFALREGITPEHDGSPADAAIPWERINIVLMGMGEPLLNIEAVHEALEVLSTQIGWRRMTLSTAGVVPGIERMLEWEERPNLAVSPDAADDERRSEIMPVNRRYPLGPLLEVLRSYPTSRRSALTFEYTLIRGFNDSTADARETARLIRGLRAKVNLIPINPDPVLGAEMRPPDWQVVKAFQAALVQAGVSCSIRRPKGDDIAAACGQLRAADRAARGFPQPVSLGAPTGA